MSVIGIDVGSSSIKAVAYNPDGKPLTKATENFIPRRPQPGWWELEPEEVWKATLKTLCQLAAAPAVRRDLPEMMAISASGREAFPVDQDGRALGPCIMAGDTRGADFEAITVRRASKEGWYSSCGHVPERMDPVNRLLWWRHRDPELLSHSRLFLGWHEFLTLRLSGRAVTDRSLAGKWCVYDLKGEWSPERLADFRIDPRILPEIQSWGTVVGQLKPSIAEETGLPATVRIAVGGFDASCAALGAGA
jgi:sugar (pentulose or hexulose) kinase